MLEDVIVEIDGRPFKHWKNISITYELNQIYGTCKFKAPDNPFIGQSLWIPGQLVRVWSNTRLIFTGSIFQYSSVVDSNQISTEITAYSTSVRLAHSSLFDSSNQNLEINENLDAFASRLISPFEIDYEIQDFGNNDQDQIINYKLSNPLSTPERELRNGLSSMSSGSFTATPEGSIKFYINESWDEIGSLVTNSIKSIRFTADETQRFRVYETISTSTASTETINARGLTEDTSVSDELRIKRRRVTGNISTQPDLDRFSEWQKNTAYGLSRKLALSCAGWRPTYPFDPNSPNIQIDSDSPFFFPGQIHQLSPTSPSVQRLKIANLEKWLLRSVTFEQTNVDNVRNEGGTTSRLNFVKPEIFVNEPRVFELPEETGNSLPEAF